MRIISGIYKGRKIVGYNLKNTRPTMDRVKESLFAMIQDKLKDKVVLDLFAGSGSLGIEALSNGAKYCYFVDHSNDAINILINNINQFNITNALIIKNDFLSSLEDFKKNGVTFDIIFLDPPYNENYLDIAIKKILALSLLNKGGLIICEFAENYLMNDYYPLKLIKAKNYGPKNIFIYQR